MSPAAHGLRARVTPRSVHVGPIAKAVAVRSSRRRVPHRRCARDRRAGRRHRVGRDGGVVGLGGLLHELDKGRYVADTRHVWLASGIFVGQLGTLASAMHLFTLGVLGGFAMAGALRFQWKRFVPVTALTVGVVAAAVVGTRAYFSFAVENAYDKAKSAT